MLRVETFQSCKYSNACPLFDRTLWNLSIAFSVTYDVLSKPLGFPRNSAAREIFLAEAWRRKRSFEKRSRTPGWQLYSWKGEFHSHPDSLMNCRCLHVVVREFYIHLFSTNIDRSPPPSNDCVESSSKRMIRRLDEFPLRDESTSV